MPASVEHRLTCSSTELVALVGLLGANAVLGISDPSTGLSQAEIDAALLEARRGLERRGYLRLAADGFLELDADVARLVRVVAQPERSYFAYLTHGSALDPIGHGTRRVFHVLEDLAVEVASTELATVTRLNGRAGVADAVIAFWNLRDQHPAGSERAGLPQAALHEAARAAAAEGHTAALARLRAAGLPPIAADALAATLVMPRANAALIAFSLDAPGQTRAIGMLEGANGLWRIRALDQRVELEPSSGPALSRLVRDFVHHA